MRHGCFESSLVTVNLSSQVGELDVVRVIVPNIAFQGEALSSRTEPCMYAPNQKLRAF